MSVSGADISVLVNRTSVMMIEQAAEHIQHG
jgi:hypothetical protein